MNIRQILTESTVIEVKDNEKIDFTELYDLMRRKHPGLKQPYFQDLVGSMIRSNRLHSHNNFFYSSFKKVKSNV